LIALNIGIGFSCVKQDPNPILYTWGGLIFTEGSVFSHDTKKIKAINNKFFMEKSYILFFNNATKYNYAYNCIMLKNIVFTIIALGTVLLSQSLPAKAQFDKSWSNPTKYPDHILLNYSDDPATTISVTWRTNRDIKKGFGEIAIAKGDPKFILNTEKFTAETSNLNYSNVVNHYLNAKKTFSNLNHNYHSVTFTGLQPNTVYAYRVGDDKHWSEWIQFTTAHKT